VQLTLEPWRLSLDKWRINLQLYSLVLEPWRLTQDKWRLNLPLCCLHPEPWSSPCNLETPHGAIHSISHSLETLRPCPKAMKANHVDVEAHTLWSHGSSRWNMKPTPWTTDGQIGSVKAHPWSHKCTPCRSGGPNGKP
jgi:hypothetical protein